MNKKLIFGILVGVFIAKESDFFLRLLMLGALFNV